MIEPRSSGGFASLVLFIGSSWLMYVKANEGKARHGTGVKKRRGMRKEAAGLIHLWVHRASTR